MRTLFTLILFVGVLALIFVAPFAGALGWAWISLMAPHQNTWGALASMPLNLILAALTLTAWLLSKESKKLPGTKLSVFLCLFAFFLILSQLFSVDANLSNEAFQRFIRVLVFVIFCQVIINSRLRIQAMIWIVVISVGYYSIKGGIFTLISGGGYHVLGPVGTMMRDNNQMGLAAATILPLIYFLYQTSANRYIRYGLIGAGGLTFICVLGTQSRGAFIALLVMGGMLWWKSKQKATLAVIAVVLAVPAITFMPQDWKDRMGTISEASEDSSFQGRLDAWHTNFQIAKARPLTGGGLRVAYDQDVADRYSGGGRKARAAHSIYFEILGGMGFVALAIYLAIFTNAWITAQRIRKTSRSPRSWKYQYATAAQVSLASFMVGGAALSMEMWDGYWLVIVMIDVTRRLQLRSRRKPPQSSFFVPKTPPRPSVS